MSKKRTLDQKNSRRKFLQGGVALGAMAPVLFANNVNQIYTNFAYLPIQVQAM